MVPVTARLLADRVAGVRRRFGILAEGYESLVLAYAAWRRRFPERGPEGLDALHDPEFGWSAPLPRVSGDAFSQREVEARLEPLSDPQLDWAALPLAELGAAREGWLGGRSVTGAYYTPIKLADRLVEPLFDAACALPGPPPGTWCVGDPALGGGALLFAWLRAARRRGLPVEAVREGLFGVDVDPLAVALARVALRAEAGGAGWEGRLLVGDALTGPPAPVAGAGLDWNQAFPELMRRGGFDVVIANPPYGGERVQGALAVSPRSAWPEVHGKADLAAYYLWRIDRMLRPGGLFAVLATNTLAQGRTRESALGPLLVSSGWTLGHAETQISWPGSAKVTVNLVIGRKGPWQGPASLDGLAVARIGSRLHDEAEPAPAARLRRGQCFEGVKVGHVRFLVPEPLARRWIAADPELGHLLRPYLGGEEVASYPEPTALRYAFDSTLMNADSLRGRWPELWSWLWGRASGLPERATPGGAAPWRFSRPRPALQAALRGQARVVVAPRVARHLMFVRIPPGPVFSEQLNVFLWADDERFGLLSSRVHEAWARRTASTLETRLRYTPSSCFVSFPAPSVESLRGAGVGGAALEFESLRFAAAKTQAVGLTTVYNLLHAGHGRWVQGLRQARARLDCAVLNAYGWPDLADGMGLCPDALPELLRRLSAYPLDGEPG